MRGTTAAPAGRSRGSEEGRGSVVAIGGSRLDPSAQLFTPVVEIPTGSGGAVPAAPFGPGSTTTAVASSPPTPAGPPALPGLTPPATTSKDKDKDKDGGRARVEATQAKGEIAEDRLLDIGVAVFDTGLSERDRERLAARGLSPELRRAEGRFVAFHLKKTMEGTGNWGAVRVLPAPAEGLDVLVTGKIVKSTGKDLELEVDAVDATGRHWLHKQYKGQADLSAYRPERVGQYEPFQAVYNRIANDLLAKRDELEAAELVTVRRVAALRFATQLAPEAFTPYLDVERSGRYSLRRFPAEGDPMVRRVSDIRDRDQMFVDTLNEHYLSFYERMGSPYASWRHDSYEEQATLDKINRESKLKQILGGVAMIAGIVMSGSDSRGGRVAGDLVMLGGYAALAGRVPAGPGEDSARGRAQRARQLVRRRGGAAARRGRGPSAPARGLRRAAVHRVARAAPQGLHDRDGRPRPQRAGGAGAALDLTTSHDSPAAVHQGRSSSARRP